MFAQENQAADSCDPENILNQPIWKFISGIETTFLYQEIMNSVRTRNATVRLPFRCDAPDCRRYLEMAITPLPEAGLEFNSWIVREEPRETVALLDIRVSRTSDIITMCSMCRKIKLSDNTWMEVEAAIHALDLFAEPELPQISHGLCRSCFDTSLAAIGKHTGNL